MLSRRLGAVINYLCEGLPGMVRHSYLGTKSSLLWSLGQGRIEQTMGLFVLGAYMGRMKWFDMSRSSLKIWQVVFLLALLGFVVLLYVTGLDFTGKPIHLKALLPVLNAWKNLAQMLMILSLFVLLYQFASIRKGTQGLNYMGRMSLSNYMLQSLIGGLIYFPYGLGFATKVNTTYSFLIGVGMIVLSILFCRWWITKYRQGPMEKLWHRLTWV